MLDQLHRLVDDFRPQHPASRALYAAGAFWLASAGAHTLLLVVTGDPWEGAVSWRKPIVFGISIGLLLATVGWVLDRLSRRRFSRWLAWTLLTSSSIEVGLITVQTWRGRASHFNVLTSVDALVFTLMGTMVAIMSLCLILVLVWSVRHRPDDPLLAWAVIGGMAVMMTGLGIGQWMIELGNDYVAVNGSVPESVVNGEAGAPKFPHAIAFHGIQLFIITARMLRHTDSAEIQKRRSMILIVSSYLGLLMLATAQSMAGHSPTRLSAWTVGVAVCGLVLLVILVDLTRRFLRTPAKDRLDPVALG